jgi:ATP-dependent protease Clp ATPase subunit
MSVRSVATTFCDFCNKTKEQVSRMIATEGNRLHICDDCVKLCVEILAEDDARNPTPPTPASRSSDTQPPAPSSDQGRGV